MAIDAGVINFGVAMLSGFIASRFKDEDTRKAMELEESEVETITKAAAHVGSFYNVPVSPLTQAWMALGFAVGSCYGPRFVGLRAKNAMKKTEAPPKPHIVPRATGQSIDIDIDHFATEAAE